MTKPQRATPHARRQFQSTPSVWRETCNLCRNAGCSMISIHSLRVEGDKQRCLKLQRPFSISIHSLRVEGDLLSQGCRGLARNFNPLPPCGGRRKRAARAAYIADFNPLPPCGGRPNVIVSDLLDAVFQSTPSVWRETENISISPEVLAISIHSLRVEGDRCCQIITYKGAPFQSTPSVWRETLRRGAADGKNVFQSTPSVWRETRWYLCAVWTTHISIHSLRVEGDMQQRLSNATPSNFNPLPPCGGRPSLTPILTSPPQFQSTPSVWRETAGGAI